MQNTKTNMNNNNNIRELSILKTIYLSPFYLKQFQ